MEEIEYLTPISDIQYICAKLGLDFDCITNVYNFGSYLHGTQTNNSDYDILIVGDMKEGNLKFKSMKDPYFYEFKRGKVKLGEEKEYEVIFHSNKNFEKLLKINYIMFIEPLFSEKKFRTICKIDYKQIYMEKYFSASKIKKSLERELEYSTGNYIKFKTKKLNPEMGGKWVIKKMYNALRYHKSFLDFLLHHDFSDFGSLGERKREFLERFEKEGDEYVDEMYDQVMIEIRNYLNQIHEIDD